MVECCRFSGVLRSYAASISFDARSLGIPPWSGTTRGYIAPRGSQSCSGGIFCHGSKDDEGVQENLCLRFLGTKYLKIRNTEPIVPANITYMLLDSIRVSAVYIRTVVAVRGPSDKSKVSVSNTSVNTWIIPYN